VKVRNALSSTSPNDEAGPSNAGRSAEDIPTIRLPLFDEPKPTQGRGDVDAAIRREGATREGGFHARQAEREQDKTHGADQGQ